MWRAISELFVEIRASSDFHDKNAGLSPAVFWVESAQDRISMRSRWETKIVVFIAERFSGRLGRIMDSWPLDPNPPSLPCSMFHLQHLSPQAFRIGILSPALLLCGSLLLYLLVLAFVLFPASVAVGQSPIAQNNDAFETHIRPLLAEKCFSCHGPTKQWSSLRLDSALALAKGGDSGPVILANQLESSPLLDRILGSRNRLGSFSPRIVLKSSS